LRRTHNIVVERITFLIDMNQKNREQRSKAESGLIFHFSTGV
jgi:hypothetical protein